MPPSGHSSWRSLTSVRSACVVTVQCAGGRCSLDCRVPPHDRTDAPADSACCSRPGYSGQPRCSQTGTTVSNMQCNGSLNVPNINKFNVRLPIKTFFYWSSLDCYDQGGSRQDGVSGDRLRDPGPWRCRCFWRLPAFTDVSLDPHPPPHLA